MNTIKRPKRDREREREGEKEIVDFHVYHISGSDSFKH